MTSTDKILLSQIAANERLLEHSEHGNFLISRPTHRIEADVESYRTRCLNRDLQTRDATIDPLTGEKQYIPAYLTHHAKAEQLKFHGIWTDEDTERSKEAAETYSDLCLRLDREGFQGLHELEPKVESLRKRLTDLLGNKADTFAQDILDIVPGPTGPKLEDPEIKFGAARDKLAKASKTFAMTELLQEAEGLHKLSALCREAILAQTELVAYRMREIDLFRDTIESRADQSARVAKVFYCTKHPVSRKAYWGSIAELEAEESEKIGWLFEQIEKFERLDLSEEEQRKRDRFNFLRHLWSPRPESSEDSPEVPQSKPDGDSPETPTTSTDPSDT